MKVSDGGRRGRVTGDNTGNLPHSGSVWREYGFRIGFCLVEIKAPAMGRALGLIVYWGSMMIRNSEGSPGYRRGVSVAFKINHKELPYHMAPIKLVLVCGAFFQSGGLRFVNA